MGYYPIFVEMESRRVLLVGGGNVAHEKIGKLVDAGAAVTVVARELLPAVREQAERGGAKVIERPYSRGDVEGYEAVFLATDDGAVNAAIADEARSLGIWVNAADDVTNCDFIIPSLAQRGNIAIATSTGGTSPAMARWLRERMEEFLSDEVVMLADVVADVRLAARTRDRECAAGCDLTRQPPPLLCAGCPNRLPADGWQDAINAEVRALRRASEELRGAQERDGDLGEELLAVLRRGEYQRAKQRMITALGIDRPLLERAKR